ncbi:hypothetical protein J6590_099958 [Homalodisca vitripennis]|nr:hypothetical protein J6590_032365 [Homalodisca vitripennis]KAG8333954.1 hypothetical protein J6590_099958 [Homalodisca vitripennis]
MSRHISGRNPDREDGDYRREPAGPGRRRNRRTLMTEAGEKEFKEDRPGRKKLIHKTCTAVALSESPCSLICGCATIDQIADISFSRKSKWDGVRQRMTNKRRGAASGKPVTAVRTHLLFAKHAQLEVPDKSWSRGRLSY